MNRAAQVESGSSPTNRRVHTYQELAADRPETNLPGELWDGEFIMSPTPSFRHQEIVFRFQRLLHDWVSPRQLGKVVSAPIDMVLSPHRAVQPDVLFVARERLQIVERVVMGPADLVAEVVSLGSRHRDRIEKRDLYEQHGVREYWILDPEASSVDVLALAESRYELVVRAAAGQLATSRLLPGFEVPASNLFQD